MLSVCQHLNTHLIDPDYTDEMEYFPVDSASLMPIIPRDMNLPMTRPAFNSFQDIEKDFIEMLMMIPPHLTGGGILTDQLDFQKVKKTAQQMLEIYTESERRRLDERSMKRSPAFKQSELTTAMHNSKPLSHRLAVMPSFVPKELIDLKHFGIDKAKETYKTVMQQIGVDQIFDRLNNSENIPDGFVFKIVKLIPPKIHATQFKEIITLSRIICTFTKKMQPFPHVSLKCETKSITITSSLVNPPLIIPQ